MRRAEPRRATLATAGALGLTIITPGIARPASENELVVASWGGPYQEALRKAHFEPFSRKTGIKVIETTFEDRFPGSRRWSRRATSSGTW